MATVKYHFLTLEELFAKYPQVLDLGWSKSSVGVFLSSYLLLGHSQNKRRKGQIDERSFQALIKFTNTLSQAHAIKAKSSDQGEYCKFEYCTPGELVEEYEDECIFLDWDETKIGRFFRCNLLKGKYTPSGQSNLITRRSFNLLIQHATETMERRPMILRGLNGEFL